MQTSVYKWAPSQYKCHYYLAPPQSLSRKQIKTKLTLCKPFFIIHGRVKGFLKVILQYKNEAPQLQKWAWHMHNEIVAINPKFKFQDKSYSTIKSKQTRNK